MFLVYLNDLWAYSIKDGVWTWISGSNETYQNGVYGIKGVPNKNNVPGSRGISTSWIDNEKNLLYLYGGNGYGSTNEFGIYPLIKLIFRIYY